MKNKFGRLGRMPAKFRDVVVSNKAIAAIRYQMNDIKEGDLEFFRIECNP